MSESCRHLEGGKIMAFVGMALCIPFFSSYQYHFPFYFMRPFQGFKGRNCSSSS